MNGRIIALLHNPSVLDLEVTNRWLDIILQDYLVVHRINGSINYGFYINYIINKSLGS